MFIKTAALPLAIFLAVSLSPVYSADIIDGNLYCSETLQKAIPNTSLKTHTFYQLRLKRFLRDGVITWTNQVHHTGARHTQTDNGGSSDYNKDRKWHFDSQWMFIPSYTHSGWYYMVNRGIPGEYAGYTTGRESGVNDNKYYVLLNPNYRPGYYPEIEDRFLWKPVQHEDGNFYQLKSKSLPYAAVTWTEKKYLDNGRYIQLDNTGDARYGVGREWHNDTLFNFEAEEEETKSYKLNISIYKFQIHDSVSDFYRGAQDEQAVKFSGKNVYENNGNETITEVYTETSQVSERVQVERSVHFIDADTIEVEPDVRVDTQDKIHFMMTTEFRKQLSNLYPFQLSLDSTKNVSKAFSIKNEREVTVSQRIEVPPCKRYKVTSYMQFIKGYPIDYTVQFKITAKNKFDERVREGLLKSHYIKEGGMTYLSTLDEYTIAAEAQGKMFADFGTNSVINIVSKPIDGCGNGYKVSEM